MNNQSRPTNRAILLLLGLLLPATIALTSARADDSAMATTRQFVDQALHILGDKQTPTAQRQQQLRQLLEPRFDFKEMSRSTLGYHWKTLSAQQRDDFADVFKNFIEAAYLNKINSYAGQQVQFDREASLGTGYAQVFTKIVQAGKAPIPVNYLLEQTPSGWKVYDVTVDNISIIANYRNQFNRILNDQGFDQLVADLKAKQQQLSLTS
ncbi:MAG TPA: ABC transporter substrate-binding protein [Candidatus Binataceae bacterium]|jgi:phospholipid transport system substrate-binding protein|nr:ABC transporter substrate-binding protein [Candidatus Binataceae bacterium]